MGPGDRYNMVMTGSALLAISTWNWQENKSLTVYGWLETAK